MRTILTTATAAILAIGLTACSSTEGDGGPVASAPLPSAPTGGSPSASGQTSAAPKQNTAAPNQNAAPSKQSTAAPTEQGGGVGGNSRAGKLSYLAPGKFMVGNTVFFTATDTVLIVAGGKCPDGAARPSNRCTVDNMEMWVKSAPRYARVSFSGQAATLIRETAG